MKESGIYFIRCKDNGRIYIGQTVNFQQRKNEHRSSLQRSKHENIHLQRIYDKYGVDSLEWSFEKCPVDRLTEQEQFYIDSFDSADLMNINLIASRPPNMTGTKWTEDRRERMSKLMSGENNPMYGREVSEETRKKIGSSSRGRKMPESMKLATSKRMTENNPSKRSDVRNKLAAAKRKLSNDLCLEVYDLVINKKMTKTDVGKIYNVSRTTIRRTVKYVEKHLHPI